ncbi:MAG: CHAD domain-containing protein [Actinomycetales bacterium]|nr:CHAD domain-containing protein [Actinomycetales bacterium]
MTTPTTHREVERKFRVHAMFDLPDFEAAGVVTSVEVVEPFTMRAVYHDTAELTLFRWGITLRRREGGSDEGWHMKLPVAGADGTTRDEIRLPLDAGATGAVPGALIEVVSPLLREQAVQPVVTLQTERAPHLLRDEDGRPLVEVVDDIVSVLRDGRTVTVFREVEVEAIDADDERTAELMSRVSDVLLALGAEASSVSKAAGALGPRTAEPPDVPEWPIPDPDGLAVDAIRAVLAKHVRHLLMADIGVRRDLPDSVHQMRVAARRIRSALGTFAPLIEPDADARLREELKWMASELGAIRDTEVMLMRLDDHAGQLDDPADGERCRAAIDPLLKARLAAARSSALAALRSDRHQQLVDDLMSAAIDPPVTDDAYAPCADVLLPLVARTWKRLRRSIEALEIDGPSITWHAARIKAKRARYAAESVAPIFGREMARYAERMSEVTEMLGEHQDAHVAQTVLRELSEHGDVDGATGMSLGILHEYEAEQEVLDRFRFEELWPKARRSARKAGVD